MKQRGKWKGEDTSSCNRENVRPSSQHPESDCTANFHGVDLPVPGSPHHPTYSLQDEFVPNDSNSPPYAVGATWAADSEDSQSSPSSATENTPAGILKLKRPGHMQSKIRVNHPADRPVPFAVSTTDLPVEKNQPPRRTVVEPPFSIDPTSNADSIPYKIGRESRESEEDRERVSPTKNNLRLGSAGQSKIHRPWEIPHRGGSRGPKSELSDFFLCGEKQ